MKDAFGGAFILRIMIAFFVIFICFMTVAVSFAKTFRVKNGVISILEKNHSEPKVASDKIEKYLKSVSYAYETNNNVIKHCQGQVNNSFSKGTSSKVLNGNVHGICVVPYGTDESYYYKVTSYIVIDFPLFHLGWVLPISGESKTINKLFQ